MDDNKENTLELNFTGPLKTDEIEAPHQMKKIQSALNNLNFKMLKFSEQRR